MKACCWLVVPFTEKRPRKLETGVKELALKKWKANFRAEKQDYLFWMYRCSRKFSAGKTQNVMFRLLFNRKPFVNGNESYLL